MNFELKMPDLATTDSAMLLIRWLVKPGERIERGQKLLEVETDKAVMPVESTTTGTLREVRFGAGDSVCAHDVIAVVDTAEVASATPPPALAVAAAVPSAQTAAASAPTKSGGLFARNREAAAHKGPQAAVPPEPVEGMRLSVARLAAGRILQQSKQTIPHFYLQTSANAGAMIARRQAALPEKIAWEAFFVRAAGLVLPKFEQLTCRLVNEALVAANTTAIGVAADVEGDLFVIPVEAPASKTVEEISSEIRSGVASLRRNEGGSRKRYPGCLTITNLGAANVETFAAIINPPEAAVLAIGKTRPVVVPRTETSFAVEQRVNLTLSVDHRIVSGRYAADFLGAMVTEIEQVLSP
jgi:pyruvate dehydrogenase E2 component (dihydrolipoamide acetyltransferase)